MLKLAINFVFHVSFFFSINICITVAILFAVHCLSKLPINVELSRPPPPSEEDTGWSSADRYVSQLTYHSSYSLSQDGHNDFPYMIRGWHLGRINSPEVDINLMPIAHTDITRLRKGLVGGVFWSAYVPWLVNTENLYLNLLSDPT
jgi:hypothetical protein